MLSSGEGLLKRSRGERNRGEASKTTECCVVRDVTRKARCRIGAASRSVDLCKRSSRNCVPGRNAETQKQKSVSMFRSRKAVAGVEVRE